MTGQELTLLGINLEFLKLIEYREDAAVNPDLSEQDRVEVLAKCDEELRLLVLREVKKVDGIAYNLTEFRRRVGKCSDRDWKEPGAIDLEIDRLKKLKARWLARHDYLEDVTIRALQFIEQAEGRNRVEGETSTLALKKCPPSVDVAQPLMVPADLNRITVKMRQALLHKLFEILEVNGYRLLLQELQECPMPELEPRLKEIGKVLKSTEPCSKCGATGKTETVTLEDSGRQIGSAWETCDGCGGTGKLSGAVPGCRLITDKVRLEVG